MEKVLFTATVDSHILSFHLPYLKLLSEKGYEVHVASNGNTKIPHADKKFNIPFERNPFNIRNYKAYKKLKYIIQSNNYKLIHCHTPVGSVITRLAAMKSRKKGTKVIYTAHGFHFYKGAPLKNWLIYYPIEKVLSKYTDCLITINSEDYKTAINKKFSAKSIKKVNGVGVDLSLFYPVDLQEKMDLRKKHNFNEDDFILIYPAELNKNKNQMLLIKVIALLKRKIPNIKLILAGTGKLTDYYKKKVKEMELEKHIIFTGYRKDIDEFLKFSDISVASSIREGLPVNIIESMACGLPVVATKNRGHRELIKNEKNGFIIDLNNVEDFANKVIELFENESIRDEMRNYNLKHVNKYSVNKVIDEMKKIYSSCIDY